MKIFGTGYRLRAMAPLALSALFLLPGIAFATDQSQQRQQGRATNQAAKQESRSTKQDCRAANDTSNAQCRQDKRDTKQDGRQQKRDIKY